jgi:hypothetical protein
LHYAFSIWGCYKKLLFAACLTSLGLTTATNAASFVFGNLIITQISPENPTTFDNNPTGPTPGTENSTVCDSAYCGPIQFSSDGGVANGTTIGIAARPDGDTSNYLWGVNGFNPLGFQGAEVIFNPANGEAGLPNSFNILLGLHRRVDDEPGWDASLRQHADCVYDTLGQHPG